MPDSDSKIIVALDFAAADQARQFIAPLDPELCKLKIGKELFTRAGPELVKECVNQGFQVFLDLKYHDIPNTVNKAVQAAAELGVWMLNVHALGGRDMMVAAKEGIAHLQESQRPRLIAVSILTSTNQQGLNELGIHKSIEQTVLDLTGMALESGLDGMVCSAQEVKSIRHVFGKQALLVTPGIRPLESNKDDQHRVMTPEQAILAGSSYLVMGRPITQSPDPLETLRQLNQSIAKAINS